MFVIASADTMYELRALDRLGRLVRSWRRHDVAAGRFSDVELEAIREEIRSRTGRNPSRPRPRIRPRFRSHALGFDAAGHLFAMPTVTSDRPTSVDVFDASGTLLSSLELPIGTHAISVRDTTLLAHGLNPGSEPTVYVYVLRE